MIRTLVLGALLCSATTAVAQSGTSYSLTGDQVAIYNIAGTVTVTSGSGSAVKVQVTTAGSDAGKLTVQTGAIRGSETLRVIYPADRIIYAALGRGSSTDMQIRDDGTWGNFGTGRWRHNSDNDYDRRLTIRGSGNGLEAYADLVITIPAGKHVGVYTGVGKVNVSNVDGNLEVDVGSADIISKDTRGALSLDTGSGNIEVTGAQGDISLDTGSGDVTVSGVKGKELSIDTGSGDVEGTDLDATDLSIDTGSGSIRIAATTTRRLSLDTGSGDVRADLVTTPDDTDVDTGSGDVTLRLPTDASATVSLDTGSGEFTVELPLTVTRKEESNLQGKLGSGKGRIEIETGSGNISLLK